MNCIETSHLQAYIDGECTQGEARRIERHLSTCPDCIRKHAEMKKLSTDIKKAINLLKTEKIRVPVFTPIVQPRSQKTVKYILYSLSAACIILFVLFFADKKIESNRNETSFVQFVPYEVNANKTLTDQDFIIEVIDRQGNHSEYFIE